MAWRSLARLSFTLIAFCMIPAVLAANKKPPAAPINLNTATSDELQQVPGIGPVTAGKILQMRKAYGPFKSVDDLRAIRGIGPKRLEKMRKYLTVGKPPAAKKTPATENIPPSPNLATPLKREEFLGFRTENFI
jgi:competence ComEA-like helix-hairpin-helix protein